NRSCIFVCKRQLAQFLFKGFPFLPRVDRQTAVQSLRQDELLTLFLSEPGRDDQPPLGVNRMTILSHEHKHLPSFAKVKVSPPSLFRGWRELPHSLHLLPLFTTFYHLCVHSSAWP